MNTTKTFLCLSLFRTSPGRPASTLSVRQHLLNLFVEHSICTVDRRNGRDRAKIRHNEFVKFYDDLTFPTEIGSFERETNKRGVSLVTVTKRVLTVTLRAVQTKLLQKTGQELSLGTIFNKKPFFITYASEKEKVLCMCILCLNIREIFGSLMNYLKTVDTSSVYSSIKIPDARL